MINIEKRNEFKLRVQADISHPIVCVVHFFFFLRSRIPTILRNAPPSIYYKQYFRYILVYVEHRLSRVRPEIVVLFGYRKIAYRLSLMPGAAD